ncbi:hypothetical protein [uncultured Paludibaculum sp.]|uniref:hypothetical protein n=1 Tax=uncultured Paludibaculum sp. TaxID=1765020 RepID=UPI002AAC3F39|nr:hypothetical protein [uncultured Paludibaculum sp.]
MKAVWGLTLALLIALAVAPTGLAKDKTPAQLRPPSKPPTIQRAMKEQKRQAKRDRKAKRKLDAVHAQPKVSL